MIGCTIAYPVTVLSGVIAAFAQPTPLVTTIERASQSIFRHEMCRTSPADCEKRAPLAPCAAGMRPSQAKERFPESRYGKASPRVASFKAPKPRGGGHHHIGKPYKVAGVWYHPKLDPDYSRVGRASWYGAAFDGRMTANGEVYDMQALSAASPTLPLPSYARVTNLQNGSSVIVRVNDRGPFAKGRIIDLSACAAKMLAYQGSGVANVRVDYVGPAPLDGNDRPFLMASYKPPQGEGIGRPAGGMMLAMNQSTTTDGGDEPAADGPLRMIGPGDPILPIVGPLVVHRPEGAGHAVQPAGIDLASVGAIPRLAGSHASDFNQRLASASAAEHAADSVLSP